MKSRTQAKQDAVVKVAEPARDDHGEGERCDVIGPWRSVPSDEV